MCSILNSMLNMYYGSSSHPFVFLVDLSDVLFLLIFADVCYYYGSLSDGLATVEAGWEAKFPQIYREYYVPFEIPEGGPGAPEGFVKEIDNGVKHFTNRPQLRKFLVGCGIATVFIAGFSIAYTKVYTA